MQINRREWIGLTAALALPASAKKMSKEYLVYVGTYTSNNKSKGIYAWRFNPATGDLTSLGLAGEADSPSFLTLHPNGRFLYAVTEGRQGGAVGFTIDNKTGMLKKLNWSASGGSGACHLAVDKTGRLLAVANYGSGSVGALAISADGTLAEKPQVIQHIGSSVNRSRQSGPHAHQVVYSADNRFLFVPDLGLDQVKIYKVDAANGTLAPNDPPFAKVPPGGGPRHLAFDPKGKYAYVVNEMGSSVTAMTYDKKQGAFTEIQTISTLPEGYKGDTSCAEIEVDAQGKYVYASNRGHDSIAVFSIGGDGKLTALEQVSTQGKVPRNFKIDPTGRYLFAANQNTDNIALLNIDPASGRLKPSGKVVDVPMPVCVLFVPVGA